MPKPTPRDRVRRAAAELLDALAADPAALGAGVRAEAAAHGLVCLVQVCPAGRRLPTAVAQAASARRKSGGQSACREDVVSLLRDAGRRLVTKEFEAAFAAAGKEHGGSTLVKALAALVRGRVLDNRHDGKGYGLTDWRRPGTPSLFGDG